VRKDGRRNLEKNPRSCRCKLQARPAPRREITLSPTSLHTPNINLAGPWPNESEGTPGMDRTPHPLLQGNQRTIHTGRRCTREPSWPAVLRPLTARVGILSRIRTRIVPGTFGQKVVANPLRVFHRFTVKGASIVKRWRRSISTMFGCRLSSRYHRDHPQL